VHRSRRRGRNSIAFLDGRNRDLGSQRANQTFQRFFSRDAFFALRVASRSRRLGVRARRRKLLAQTRVSCFCLCIDSP